MMRSRFAQMKSRRKPRSNKKPRNEVRRYGFYRCSKCSKVWESANAYCIRGTFKALYTQKCKECDVGVLPYKTEPLKCSLCGEEAATCPCDREDRDDRHVDPNKPHRADLCQRCLGGNPCRHAF